MVHWVAPITLASSFIAGIGFAVGHHFFYAQLDGAPVDSTALTQQYNTAVGTASAFLCRAALVIAVTTTYWQVFFGRLQQNLPISTIDSLAGLIGALKEFLSFSVYRASPLLVTLALLAWLIPAAVIFPPATLSVVSTNATRGQDFIFQTPNYTDAGAFARVVSQYWGGMGGNSAPSHYMTAWMGPTSQLKRKLIPVAYQGELPTFSAPMVNSSYEMQFFGPAVSCQSISPDSMITNLSAAVKNDMFAQDYYYVSWTPGHTSVPFENDSVAGAFPVESTLGADQESRLVELFVASRGLEDWSVLNCSLWNASYALAFRFENGKQDVKISAFEIQDEIRRPAATSPVPTDYFAMADQEVLSYFAVMDLLGDLLAGTMWHSRGDSLQVPSKNNSDHTRVLETNLAFTPELHPLYISLAGGSSEQKPLSSSLASAIEELVKNMTISLLAVPETLAPQAQSTTISVTTSFNVYQYNWQRLALAYGIAIGLTFVAVVTGLYTIISTGNSYSNRISTILRVSRNEELDVLIEKPARDGQDPLPKHIGKAKFALAGNKYERLDTTSRQRSFAMNSLSDMDPEYQTLKGGTYETSSELNQMR